MAYTALTFVYGEVLTSTKMNALSANDASFHDGTGINDSAITTAKLAAEAVETAKIDDGAVTTAKLAAGAVTAPKIDPTVFGFGNYSTTEINTGFKWVNGKTIYKKTILFNNNVVGQNLRAFTCETVVKFEGRMYSKTATNNTWFVPYYNGDAGIILSYENGNIGCGVFGGTSAASLASNYAVQVTVYYTKA